MKTKDLSKQAILELLDVVRETKKVAKKELPKVAEDLIKEGVIDSTMGIISSSVFILHALIPIYHYVTFQAPQIIERYRDAEPSSALSIYTLISSVVAALAVIALGRNINSLLIAKKAPRAFLFNKLMNLLQKDDE